MSNYTEVSTNILQRQYLYTNVAKLCIEKATVWNKYIGDFSGDLNKQILNFNTCSSSALDNFWGKIFKIQRVFYNTETNEEFTLTDDEFREIIKLRAFSTTWNGSLYDLNIFLLDLFKSRGKAICIDSLNMTSLIFSFDFALEDWELYLFRYTNILPRPAGVGSEISIIDTDTKYFGFATYNQIIESPITVGFGTYENEPMGQGEFATYDTNI